MVFANLRQNMEIVKERIEKACQKSGRNAGDVTLVVVTKNHPVQTIQAILDLGIRDIGENRVREIEEKVPVLHGDFSLHMIGHLQTNKAAKVVPLVDWVQSVDSSRLAEKIDAALRQDALREKKLKALVEVNISGEASKSGCASRECYSLCEKIASLTIGPLTGGETATRKAFETLRKLGEQCRHFTGGSVLSMGMSSDFDWAIEEGSTMVRIGSLILGNRP
jgi:pyridoxal phosphate enzyme (YggS family)